jgi:hypothetical protein
VFTAFMLDPDVTSVANVLIIMSLGLVHGRVGLVDQWATWRPGVGVAIEGGWGGHGLHVWRTNAGWSLDEAQAIGWWWVR